MRLTKIEINGFKSFAKKTEIEIEEGITAIIGPNGCGKSNIADAVRWVLGEQSARVLRGTKMEDVIFNGTENRKAQSFCEVTLTFDNMDGQLPTEFTEVSITRRVYRSGESEYLINRRPCRLKDIQGLFRDTGIGREGYSVIGQGKVEEILSNKSSDRRSAFEEAAGVMKYRVRKEEAERKLENTAKNLVRLNDILEELENQIGPLEEQSAVAREFLQLRDELKETEVNVFLYQYDRLTERIKTSSEAMEQFEREIEMSSGVEAALQSDCAAGEEEERKLGAAIGEVQNRLLSMSSGVESRSGEAKVVQERMANLGKDRERLESQVADSDRQCQSLEEEIRHSFAGMEGNKKNFEDASAVLSITEEQLRGFEKEISEKEEQLENEKSRMIEAMNRLSDAKSRISRLEAIKSTLLTRQEAIGAEQKAIEAEAEKLNAEYADANVQFLAIREKYEGASGRQKAAIEARNERNALLLQCAEEVRKLEQLMESGKSRIKVLQEMKQAYEGYYSSVRNVLRDAHRDPTLGHKLEGVVAELVRVPQQYEAAIEMAMGSALQNIVTPTEQDAKEIIEYIRQKQYGRVTLLPVSAMRSRLLSKEELGLCRVKGFLGVASDLLKYDARYRGVVENLLGRTIVVENLDVGIEINRRARFAFRIATLQGDIINPGGSMTGGSMQKREFSLIGREREIAELEGKLVKAAEKLAEKQKESKTRKIEISAATEVLEQIGQEVHQRDMEMATQREKLDVIRKYVEENQQELQNSKLESSQIVDNIENIDEQCRAADADRSNWEQGNVASQDDIRSLQEALIALRTQSAMVNGEVTQQKVALMALEKELGASQNEHKRLQRDRDALLVAIAKNKKEIEESVRQFDALRATLLELGSRIDVERKDVDDATDELRAMEEERAKYLVALDEMRGRREATALELSELRERRHKAELSLNRSQLELQNMQDKIWDEYQLTYENALPMRREIAITASHIKVDELRTAIKELGDVNVNSIEDYRNVKERFDSLRVQCEDLEKAETDLKELISGLVATMEQEFKRRFIQIQQNFSEVFSELFSGGRAELVLSDAGDILNCDIDIIAQPPGKKLQLLSLLSGGERALTAIALLFAMLKLKPTAFCILDEIEAALDEVNVTSFAQYVRNYSKDTQFILITHHKGSMQVCDSLYGVAMEERGVSKVVSARFSDIA